MVKSELAPVASVSVAFIDPRGFTALAESADREEMMEVLEEHQHEMGRISIAQAGTLERVIGDGMMIVFDDPVEMPNPEERAARRAPACAQPHGR